jgi:hypothetical protein
MPEAGACTETLRVGPACAVGGVVMVPIERIVRLEVRLRIGAGFSVTKAPHALVVRVAGSTYAVGADAGAISLERLCRDVPQLDAVLASL